MQADKSCNFIELTDLIHHLLKAAWGSDWGIFSEAFPNGRDPENVKLPTITYRIVSKVPGIVGNNTREIKPRFRGTFDIPNKVDGGPDAVNVYSQVFDYEVMFDLWHENNTKADALAEQFEDFMMTWTGFMMKEGVNQLIFLEMTGDNGDSLLLRDRATSRHFKYLVRLEKHVEVPTAVIKEIIGKVSIARSLPTDQDQSIEVIDFKSK